MNQSIKRLIEYVLTVHLENTPEWLEGLVEKINEYAEENSSNQRVQRFKNGLCIIDEKEFLNHACGLQGYDGMIDPPCPACKITEQFHSSLVPLAHQSVTHTDNPTIDDFRTIKKKENKMTIVSKTVIETQYTTEIQNKIILDAIRYYKEFIKNDDVIREYGFEDINQLEKLLENK